MKKLPLLKQKVSLILLSAITSYLTYLGCYAFAEKYFFDRLFYRKSSTHGYLTKCDVLDCHLEIYGRRSEDLRPIFFSEIGESQVLGNSIEEVYSIAIIGDSVVWGMGIRESDTLSKVLEKKLNKLKKVNVLQLGFPGDSLADNYLKYLLIKSQKHIDLSVFLIVENDLLYKPTARYAPDKYFELLSVCGGLDNLTLDQERLSGKDYRYKELLFDSFTNTKNLCVSKNILNMFPKDETLFLQIGPPEYAYTTKETYQEFQKILDTSGLDIINVRESRRLKKYDAFWKNFYKLNTVSQNDGHPSKRSNEMFADLLYNKIIERDDFKTRD